MCFVRSLSLLMVDDYTTGQLNVNSNFVVVVACFVGVDFFFFFAMNSIIF